MDQSIIMNSIFTCQESPKEVTEWYVNYTSVKWLQKFLPRSDWVVMNDEHKFCQLLFRIHGLALPQGISLTRGLGVHRSCCTARKARQRRKDCLPVQQCSAEPSFSKHTLRVCPRGTFLVVLRWGSLGTHICPWLSPRDKANIFTDLT